MAQVDEARSLTSDVLEIYNDWGTSNIKLHKFLGEGEDTLYNEGESKYSDPYKCVGRYSMTPVEEQQTGVGLAEDEAFYTVFIVKDILDQQGVTEVTPRDILSYNGNTLDILSVKYSAILGDYTLQYKIYCKGRMFDLKRIYE